MTRLTFFLIASLWASVVQAQSNTFPTSGNVGIGTGSPQLKLDVQGGGLSISGRNPVSSVNEFGNALQLKHTGHAAIVYNPGEDTELMFGFHSNGNFYWGSKTNGYGMSLNKSGFLRVYGDLQIGSKRISGYALSVDGKAVAREVKVTVSEWPDYVFRRECNPMPLHELSRYIGVNGHLPGIPSADEVEANGVNIGEMNAKLLEKVEELTLYLIEKDKAEKQLFSEVAALKAELAIMKAGK